MNKTFIKVWCEWDIGQEYAIFSTYDSARNWLEKNPILEDMATNDSENDYSLATLEKGGFIGFDTLLLVE